MKRWKVDDFAENFDRDNIVFEDYLQKRKDVANPSYKTKIILQKYLKAAIANELFSDVGFYKIMHREDKMIQKVLELEANQ